MSAKVEECAACHDLRWTVSLLEERLAALEFEFELHRAEPVDTGELAE